MCMRLGYGSHGGGRFELQPEDIVLHPEMAGGMTPEVWLIPTACHTHIQEGSDRDPSNISQ